MKRYESRHHRKLHALAEEQGTGVNRPHQIPSHRETLPQAAAAGPLPESPSQEAPPGGCSPCPFGAPISLGPAGGLGMETGSAYQAYEWLMLL